jgi:GT2 family glycosyltransferase
MVWTDMVAVDDSGNSLADAYLRTMYTAYSRVNISEVMGHRGAVGQLDASNIAGLETAPILAGDIFPYMLLGNLVHTSTVLLRRDRVRAAGSFDESLKISGEDYDFHLKTCFAGPVGFLDVSSIRYRVGASDQLTSSRFMLQVARNNLTTVVRWTRRGGRRLDVLGEEKLRSALGNAHAWLGVEEYQAGNRQLARRHLGKSFTLGNLSGRNAAMYAVSFAPPAVARLVSSLRATV